MPPGVAPRPRMTGSQSRVVAEDSDVTTCRVCHCTEQWSCPGGCRWVEDDLCSACLHLEEAVDAIEEAMVG